MKRRHQVTRELTSSKKWNELIFLRKVRVARPPTAMAHTTTFDCSPKWAGCYRMVCGTPIKWLYYISFVMLRSCHLGCIGDLVEHIPFLRPSDHFLEYCFYPDPHLSLVLWYKILVSAVRITGRVSKKRYLLVSSKIAYSFIPLQLL